MICYLGIAILVLVVLFREFKWKRNYFFHNYTILKNIEIILHWVLNFPFACIFRLKNDSGDRISTVQAKLSQISKLMYKNLVISVEGTSAINWGEDGGDKSQIVWDIWGSLHQALLLQNKMPTDKELQVLHFLISRISWVSPCGT